MNILSQDLARYTKAVQDLAHLIKTFGSKEVLADLRYFYPEQYEDMIKALEMTQHDKKLARLLDASQGGRRRIGMEDFSLVGERSDSDKGTE